MFDGNHRSKRTVRYGAQKGTDRKSLLEATKRKREERAKRQKQVQCSQTVQRVWKGYKTRQQLCREWETVLATSDTTDARILNMRLSPVFHASDVTAKESWINKLAGQLGQQIPGHWGHRIIWHTVTGTATREQGQTVLNYYFSNTNNVWMQLGFASGFSRHVELLLLSSRQTWFQHTLSSALWTATPTSSETGRTVACLIRLLYGETVDSSLVETVRTELLRALSGRLASTKDSTRHSPVAEQALESVLKSILSTKTSKIMSRLLESVSADDINIVSALIQKNSVLRMYAGLAAKGSSLGDIQAMLGKVEMDVDEDSEDEAEDDDPHFIRKRKAGLGVQSPTSQPFSKSSLQTLPKLDRLQKTELWGWQKHVGHHNVVDEDTWAVARKLADPRLWLRWFEASSFDHTASMFDLLSMLLSSFTTLSPKPSSLSPLLSRLAVGTVKEDAVSIFLWRRLQALHSTDDARHRIVALSVLADIWAQKLIALSDDQFVRQFVQTTTPFATPMVAQVRDLLHDLYWLDPVRSEDFTRMFYSPESIQFARCRLLLTGTKVWVSLHERWCRTTPRFCDESVWLFPTPLSESATPKNENAMQIDSDEEDEGQPDDELASFFTDAKLARVLTAIPQVIPFERRVKLFQSLIAGDRRRTQANDSHVSFLSVMQGGDAAEMFNGGRVKAKIRRDSLYEDSMASLNELGTRLRRRVQVTFLNHQGTEEAGIDGGGVFKEFIDDLVKDVFLHDEKSSSPYRLFDVHEETLGVNTSLTMDNEVLQHYEFAGRILGKAMYESILVDPQFCLPFLNQLLGKKNSLEDLRNFDPQFYRSLMQLRSLPATEIAGLSLMFEVDVGTDGAHHTVELLPGGSQKAVTHDNVIQYVYLVANHRLNKQSAVATRAFLMGFRDLIPESWMKLFHSHELQKLLSGDGSVKGIDVQSLKDAMQYASGYHPSQPVIKYFWEIVEEMTPDQQRKFLRFMTSCSRQPLLGFKSLDPPPCLQQLHIPPDLRQDHDLERLAKQVALPSASTCFHQLKMPNYSQLGIAWKPLMKWKLLAAIESGAGFELT